MQLDCVGCTYRGEEVSDLMEIVGNYIKLHALQIKRKIQVLYRPPVTGLKLLILGRFSMFLVTFSDVSHFDVTS